MRVKTMSLDVDQVGCVKNEQKLTNYFNLIAAPKAGNYQAEHTVVDQGCIDNCSETS